MVVSASLLSRLRRECWLQSTVERSGQGVTVWKVQGRVGMGQGVRKMEEGDPLSPIQSTILFLHRQFLCPQSLTDPTYINMRTKKILAQHIVSFSFRMCKEFQLIQ